MNNSTPIKNKKAHPREDYADFLYLISIAKRKAQQLRLSEAAEFLDMSAMSAYLELTECKIEDIDDSQELFIKNMIKNAASG